jgi:hypothetical protein
MSLKCVIDIGQCELVLLGVGLGMGRSGGGFHIFLPIFFSIHTKDFCEINGLNFLDFEE